MTINLRALRPRRGFATPLALSLSFQRWRDEADEMLCGFKMESSMSGCAVSNMGVFSEDFVQMGGTDRRV